MLKTLEAVYESWEGTTLFYWNDPWNYVTLYHDGPHLVTWHAPWCSCDLTKAAYEFIYVNSEPAVYISGLGFEITWLKNGGR